MAVDDLPGTVDLEGQASDAIYRAIEAKAPDCTTTEELLDLSYAFSYVTYGRNGGRDVRIEVEVPNEGSD